MWAYNQRNDTFIELDVGIEVPSYEFVRLQRSEQEGKSDTMASGHTNGAIQHGAVGKSEPVGIVELNRLHEAIEQLEARTDLMTEALCRVMAPIPPQPVDTARIPPPGGVPPQPYTSHVASGIAGARAKVDDLNSRLDYLIDRLEF